MPADVQLLTFSQNNMQPVDTAELNTIQTEHEDLSTVYMKICSKFKKKATKQKSIIALRRWKPEKPRRPRKSNTDTHEKSEQSLQIAGKRVIQFRKRKKT